MGTAVTPAVGSKGSWVTAIASLDADCFGLLICINSNSAASASRNTVVDIGVGSAGSEIVVIPDLIAGNAVQYTGFGGGLWYWFPVFIPAGSRIALRSQGNGTAAFNVWVQAFQSTPDPAAVRVASYVEAVGMTVPEGVAVTAGTTAEGSWTLLGTTTKDCWWWQMGVQVSAADTGYSNLGYHADLAEGDGTNYRIILDSQLFATNSSEQLAKPVTVFGCEQFVPAGRNIYARAQVSSGTPDPLFIAAYGAGG